MQRAPCFDAASSVERQHELAIVAHALLRRQRDLLDARELHETGDLAHSAPAAFCFDTGAGFAAASLRVHLGQRTLVLGREDLDEFPARRLPVVEDRERERAAGVSAGAARSARATAPRRTGRRAAGGPCRRRRDPFPPSPARPRSAPAPSRPSRCCSAWRRCRRRRRRTRCRRSFRPRNCARCGPARRPCRRSCTRSRGHPCPSTTADAPELRTQKRSPATPRKYASPAMAPYITVLPMTMLASGFAGHAG